MITTHRLLMPRSQAPARRAFTLIEMIIVVLILAVLIAILIPAAGGVNRAAKKTSSAALMNQLGTASQQFKIDNNRQPGYFTAADVGSIANNSRGFTALENIMLDLAGGVVGAGNEPPPGAGANPAIILVGPHPTDTSKQVYIDVNLIGTPTVNANNQAQAVGSTGAYFVPDPKHYVVQRAARANTPGAQPGDNLKKWCANAPTHYRIPDVVDSFGSPLLAWVEDETPNTDVDFIAVQNQTTTRAKYYWVSNAAFLRAQSLGKIGQDQRATAEYSGNAPPFSLIGSVNNGNLKSPEGLRMMEAVLGNPAYPDPSGMPPPVNSRPAAGRGKVILHSAGSDGFYVGSREQGGKIAVSHLQEGRFPYNPNASDMNIPKRDAMEGFDDIWTVAGN